MNRMIVSPTRPEPRRRSWTGTDLLALAAFVAGSLLAGGIGAVLQSDALQTWYPSLDKPSFTPPSWLFAPVWTTLYVLIGIAAWLDWRARDDRRARISLALFGAQLVLNAGWTGIFFGLQQPGWALVEILVLLGVIVAWIVTTWKPARLAALLLLPYAAWVSFATALTAGIVLLN